jgi:rod shape determining protein RodA
MMRSDPMRHLSLREFDLPLLLAVLVIIVLGITTIYSASRQSGLDAVKPYYLKQIVWLMIAIVVVAALLLIDYHLFLAFSPVAYGGVVLLLIAVLLVGRAGRLGARRWIEIAGIGIQPSELAKIAVVLMMARYIDAVRARIRRFHFFILGLAIAGIAAVLIVVEPHLGNAAILAPLAIVMLYAGGCSRKHILVVAIVGLALSPVLWHNLKEYQKDRLLVFLHPESDPLVKGYQVIQSEIAVGSGGIVGKGWCEGTQSGLSFLPEQHTDFIFSVFAEEWGFLGVLVLLLLYGFFIIRGLRIARESKDFCGGLLCVGMVSLIGMQVIANIAMAIRLMPVTGLPLPFFSYGGSFLLTTMVAVGVLLNVRLRSRTF